MQTPLQLDIWLQSYEEFVNGKNNIKQRNWNTVFANISKPLSPTSDSFLLIMSHMTHYHSSCVTIISTDPAWRPDSHTDAAPQLTLGTLSPMSDTRKACRSLS